MFGKAKVSHRSEGQNSRLRYEKILFLKTVFSIASGLQLLLFGRKKIEREELIKIQDSLVYFSKKY